MPTLVCTSDDLALQSSCYRCFTQNQAGAVELYLLAKIAGLDGQTVQQIITSARCWNCIPYSMQKPVSLYLLCQKSQPSVGCEPQYLAVYAQCFECLSGIQLRAAKIYLLALKAGLDGLSNEELFDLAKCWVCVPSGLRYSVKNYLLCYGLGDCVPEDVAQLASCYRCISGIAPTVELRLLCVWNGVNPPVTGIVLGNPDAGIIFGDPNSGTMFGIP